MPPLSASPPAIANAGAAQLLVLVHALCGLALVGAATHHMVVAVDYWRGIYRIALARTYATVTLVLWAATFLLGALAYPSYRYFVRGLYLDWHKVWASNLFDIKENFAALGLPLAVALFLCARSFDPREAKLLVGPYVALVWVAGGLAWFAAVAGLIITLQRGVPA